MHLFVCALRGRGLPHRIQNFSSTGKKKKKKTFKISFFVLQFCLFSFDFQQKAQGGLGFWTDNKTRQRHTHTCTHTTEKVRDTNRKEKSKMDAREAKLNKATEVMREILPDLLDDPAVHVAGGSFLTHHRLQHILQLLPAVHVLSVV